MKKNQKGFGSIEGLLILIIVGMIGFVGWYVYHTKTNTDKILETAASTSTVISATKNASGSTKPTTSDPYSGWKKYTTKYEKLSFMYPAPWTLTDSSTSTSGDSISLSANPSLVISMEFGAFPGIDTSGNMEITSETTSFTGRSAKLIFWTAVGSTDRSQVSMVQLVSNNETIFNTKNVNIPLGGQSDKGNIDLSIGFGTNSDGSPATISIQSLQSNTNFKEAILIIQSMAY